MHCGDAENAGKNMEGWKSRRLTRSSSLCNSQFFVFSLVSVSQMPYNTPNRVETYPEKESAKHEEKPSFQEKTRFPVSDVAEWEENRTCKKRRVFL